jgi:microcystin-dependent protein
MSTPYIGEIRIISFNFAPKGWALCNGQLLPINQNQALFSILGTTYGGDGRVNFALPDFRGRAPVHMGAGYNIGQRVGEEAHTLIVGELPQHNHVGQCSSNNASTANPVGAMLAGIPSFAYRNSLTNMTTLQPATVGLVGGSQPHENRQPYLTLGYIIALQGIFPSRN